MTQISFTRECEPTIGSGLETVLQYIQNIHLWDHVLQCRQWEVAAILLVTLLKYRYMLATYRAPHNFPLQMNVRLKYYKWETSFGLSIRMSRSKVRFVCATKLLLISELHIIVGFSNRWERQEIFFDRNILF